ncbi:MAG: DNA polymerase III subunit gamma/tau [Chloroflexota bacterium]
MPAQALYLKWRPRAFDHVIGQAHITQSLRNALIQDRVRHAYLFNGPRGTGKTTMARILAKAVNCLHPDPAERPCDECQYCVSINEGRFLDLIEIDAASHNGVDDVRDLREKIAFAPSEGRYKVYIIDEVHRFSGAAFDALLKTLEEPPDHAIFILATTELDKVPATIKSRSLTYEFRRVSLREVTDRLEMICEFEGIKADRDALELVARQGTGSVRDSISLLDQLISDPNQRITLEMAEQVLGTASNRAVGKLVQAIIDDDVSTGLDLLNQAIDEGADPSQFGKQIVEYLRNVLLVQNGGPSLVDASDEQRATFQQHAGAIGRAALVRAIRAFNTAVVEGKGGWQPQLPLELALVESTRPIHEDVAPVEAIRPAKVSEKPQAAQAKAAPDAEAPSSASSGAVVSLGDLQKAWPMILRKTKEVNQSVGATLEHAAIKSLEEGRLLVLAVQTPIFKQKLEADDRRKILIQVIKSVTKADLQIKIVVGGETAPQTDDTIASDPLLGELMKSGGTITSVEDSQGGLE